MRKNVLQLRTDVSVACFVFVGRKSCKVARCSRQPAESGLSPACGSLPTHAGVSAIKGPTVSRRRAQTWPPELHQDQLEPRVPPNETRLDSGGLCSAKMQKAPTLFTRQSEQKPDPQPIREERQCCCFRATKSGRRTQIFG